MIRRRHSVARQISTPVAWTIGVVLVIIGCFWRDALAGSVERLPVVTSFSILGDLTQRIGGDRVQVRTLVGPGTDAHIYRPTPADIKSIAQARLLIVNGLGLEGWIDSVVPSSGFRGQLVIASQGIQALRRARPSAEEYPGQERGSELDPHAWQDLTNTRRYVDNIASALAEADPASKLLYQANAARLKQEMSALDSEIHATFNALPAEHREVATSHDAFAYLGRAYGIRFIAPVGLSTAVEPTTADVGAIIRQIRQKRIRALFIENIAGPRLLERISRESGARISGTLYSDSLAQRHHPADSYLGMMRHNARTLAAALAN